MSVAVEAVAANGYADAAHPLPKFSSPRRVPQGVTLLPGVPKTFSFLQQCAELVGGQLTVSEDLVQQTGADGLTRVRRHNRAPAVLVTQKVMTAFNAKNAKTELFEGGNELITFDAGIPGSCRDGHALDADELQVLPRHTLDFET